MEGCLVIKTQILCFLFNAEAFIPLQRCCFHSHNIIFLSFPLTAGWWNCCPSCTFRATGASRPSVSPMPKPPQTRSCTACCGSSTAGFWWASSAAWWARTATRCPPTASAARWTPRTTTTVWPESPERSLWLALKKNVLIRRLHR